MGRLILPGQRPLSPVIQGTFDVLRLLPRVSASRTILLAVGTLITATLPVVVTVLSGEFVGLIPDALREGLDSPTGQTMVRLLILVGILIVLQHALDPLQYTLANTFARLVDRHLQERLMAAVNAPRTIDHLEDPATLDLIRNAQGVGDEGLHPGDAVRALASLLPSWLQAIGSALILLAFHWWLGLLWLALWPVVLYVLQGEFVRVGQASGTYAAVVRRSDYFRDLALTPEAAKELRIFGLREWLRDQFDAAWLAAMRPVWATRQPGRPLLWLVAAGVLLTNLGALALLVWSAIQGDVSLAALAIYTRAILDASAFRAFDDANAHLAHAAVSVPNLLELERRLVNPTAASSVAEPVLLFTDAPREAIRLENLAFRYPGANGDVLANLDLVIPAGKSLAIVGANGAGKTTLIKLLCRLSDPTAGRILVDGQDLAKIDPRTWQRRVAAIFQDFVHYHLSARDNVALGGNQGASSATPLPTPPSLEGILGGTPKPPPCGVVPQLPMPRAGFAPPNPSALDEAAEKADALDLIASLPHGWETILSRQYTGGVDLSGGQWQRVALARAFFAVAGGARVLILDEPTASLDVRAEARLYDRFLEITAGLTTILISHRFSTVRRADRICVLGDGRIVEQGTHDELMARGGRYATMFALQAARFADENEDAELVGIGGRDGDDESVE